jgi:hypothetical protein
MTGAAGEENRIDQRRNGILDRQFADQPDCVEHGPASGFFGVQGGAQRRVRLDLERRETQNLGPVLEGLSRLRKPVYLEKRTLKRRAHEIVGDRKVDVLLDHLITQLFCSREPIRRPRSHRSTASTHLQTTPVLQDGLGIKCTFQKVVVTKDGKTETRTNFSPVKDQIVSPE